MLIINSVPTLLTAFVATTLISFVLGLELHSYRRAVGQELGFGTTRTLTLLGILGFVLWALEKSRFLYGVGLALVGILLGIYYWHRVRAGSLSLLSSLFAFLVFLLGPIVQSLPLWFVVLYVVVLIVMLGEKPGIRRLSDAFRSEEGITLAKFLILAALVLPLLPNRPIAPAIGVTYYQVWLAVIVVSGISYLSYLAQTYFFPKRGILLTGVLGGLYSSTAATVVLARRVREENGQTGLLAPALILATAMMYLRLWVIIFILGHRIASLHLAGPFALFAVASLIVAFAKARHASSASSPAKAQQIRHPLEMTTAILFAFLFIFFAGLTRYVTEHFGTTGLHMLSFASGFTDIDPFILALLAGKFHVGEAALETAIVVASGSNNLLKAVYTLALARRREAVFPAAWLGLLFVASLVYARWVA